MQIINEEGESLNLQLPIWMIYLLAYSLERLQQTINDENYRSSMLWHSSNQQFCLIIYPLSMQLTAHTLLVYIMHVLDTESPVILYLLCCCTIVNILKMEGFHRTRADDHDKLKKGLERARAEFSSRVNLCYIHIQAQTVFYHNPL